uniref:Transmembrane protein 119b n=1 Tax=Mastacembelus armatus TaxID=205130 RepID=A0A7N8Y5N4_9TELE
MALHQISLCVVFCISSCLTTPLSLYTILEGSTDEEEFGNLSSPLPTHKLSPEYQTTPVIPTHRKTDFLGQVVKFLEENKLLIFVSATFTLLVFLIISGAIFMSRRRKVNAYYPSSFPSKMYVDIMRAAKSLRTPNKSVDTADGSDPSHKVADHSPEDCSKPDGSIVDQPLPSLPEEKEQREPSESEPVAVGGSPEQSPAEHFNQYLHPTIQNIHPSGDKS